MKYRKKPIEVEAEVYKPGMEDGFLLMCGWYETRIKDGECLRCGVREECRSDNKISHPYIKTTDGRRWISPGDYIVTGIQGERYPVKSDIFLQSYEEV